MKLEGELHVRLALRNGRVVRVQVDSSRPDAAQLLRQRSPQELRAAVPRLFSICGVSQGIACELALAAATGTPPDTETLAHGSAAVAAEIVREVSRRALLDAPRHLGENPGGAALQIARTAMQWQPGDAAASVQIAKAAFGMPASDWLALDTPAAIGGWIDGGSTAAARELRPWDDGTLDDAGDAAPLLPAAGHAAQVAQWLPALDTDGGVGGFARRPLWRGRPAETGALARQQTDPLIAALLRDTPGRVRTRLLARLRELAKLLDGEAPLLAGIVDGGETAPGDGVAWVENARGLLVHQLRLVEGRNRAYRIVAPTEWNFHPEGALPLALQGIPVTDADDAHRRAERLINSLDPCVACRVECVDA